MKHLGESQRRTAEMKAQFANKKGFASGGRVASYPQMTAGAASGDGRIEKIEKYGDKATKGK